MTQAVDATAWVILPLIAVAAGLYAMVGHAGASSYLALMALAGMAPGMMKPTALVLNCLVAAIATLRFALAGQRSWRLLVPFLIGSVPAAWYGGWLQLPPETYRRALGVLLLYAAWRVVLPPRSAVAGVEPESRPPPPLPLAIAIGAAIGFASGVIGIGGGILLSPVLLLARWAPPRLTAGVSAAFILCNSLAGLAGHWQARAAWPEALPWWAGAAAFGGWIGATLGARHVPPRTLRWLLAAVLVVAGVKLAAT